MTHSWLGNRVRAISGAAALLLATLGTAPLAAHAESITLYLSLIHI